MTKILVIILSLAILVVLVGCTIKEQPQENVPIKYSDSCISLMNNFDSFILDPFESNVGSLNEHDQKEAEVIATLIEIGEPEFQPGKYGPSNYKRNLIFKGTQESKTLTYVFKDESTLHGLGKEETQLDLLTVDETYKLSLLANPPSPTVSIYLTSYEFFDCSK